MANGEIKQTIRLAGEKEYTSALKSANTQLRTLKSALKAETAELGKNATAQEKNAVKAENLKKQIAEQEKIVATLKKALAEAKKNYGDNEEVVAKWETKLNNARATLAGMQNDLEGLGDGVKGATNDINMGTVATRSFAESLASIGEKCGSVSDSIERIFMGVVGIVRDAVGELWDLVSETAAKANNWTDLAGYYGSSAQDIQKWEMSIRAAGGSFEDFLQLVNTFAYGGKNDAIETWFGISDANYTNMIDYTIAALGQMQEARRAMTEGEMGAMSRAGWNSAMQEIFGTKKSQTAEWFFGAWDDWFNKADRFNGEGLNYGMDAEELQTLNDVAVQIAEIETKWNAIKRQFASGFGEITGTLLINVSGGLDALNSFLKAETPEEREAALKDLKDNMEEFFRKLADAIRVGLKTLQQVGEELAGSDDPITATIGKALLALQDVGQWIIDNSAKLVTAMEAIAGVWVAGKGLEMANTIAGMVANIATIKTFMGGGAAGAAAGAGGSGGGLAGGVAGGLAVKAGSLFAHVGPALAGIAQNVPLIAEAYEQIKNETLFGMQKSDMYHPYTEAELKEQGVVTLPEVNVLSLLLNPLNEIARLTEKAAEDDAKEKNALAIDTTNTKWVDQFGDVRWGWKDWSWNHDDMWATMPEGMFAAGEQDEIESLIASHEASIQQMNAAVSQMPDVTAKAVRDSMGGVSFTVYVRSDDLTRNLGGSLARMVYLED